MIQGPEILVFCKSTNGWHDPYKTPDQVAAMPWVIPEQYRGFLRDVVIDHINLDEMGNSFEPRGILTSEVDKPSGEWYLFIFLLPAFFAALWANTLNQVIGWIALVYIIIGILYDVVRIRFERVWVHSLGFLFAVFVMALILRFIVLMLGWR